MNLSGDVAPQASGISRSERPLVRRRRSRSFEHAVTGSLESLGQDHAEPVPSAATRTSEEDDVVAGGKKSRALRWVMASRLSPRAWSKPHSCNDFRAGTRAARILPGTVRFSGGHFTLQAGCQAFLVGSILRPGPLSLPGHGFARRGCFPASDTPVRLSHPDLPRQPWWWPSAGPAKEIDPEHRIVVAEVANGHLGLRRWGVTWMRLRRNTFAAST